MSRPSWLRFSDESMERFREMPLGERRDFYDPMNNASITVARCGRPESLYLFITSKTPLGTRNYVEYDHPEFDPLAAYPVKFDVEFVTEARPQGQGPTKDGQ